ncbi:probable cytochrome P450 49a1 [Magallana gigas]|uniref:probable cytochrome P450 49a1 n=1 Tax=Magallana gigas TaxID=29159 RepID=UPI00333EB46C
MSSTIKCFMWRSQFPLRLPNVLSTSLYSSNPAPAQTTKHPDVRPLEDIPGVSGKSALPYVGSIFLSKSLDIGADFQLQTFCSRLQKKYGDIVRTRIKDKWAVFIFHPDLAKEVLEIQVKYPYRPPIDIVRVYNDEQKLSQNLATLNGEAWARLRKPTQQLIQRPLAVFAYVDILSKVAEDFVQKYQDGGTFDDLRPVLANYATESVGMLCFNRRFGCLDKKSIIDITLLEDMFDAIDKDLRSIVFKPYIYVSTPLYRQFKKAADHLFSISQSQIKNALSTLEKMKSEGKLDAYLEQPNLLYSLLSHPKMTPADVDRTIVDLFVAGVESTSNTLTILWFELAKNQDKQDKLYKEISSVCGNGDVTKEALANMSYLKACVRETMRIYSPTSPGSYRRFDKDVVVGGYHIPAGTELVLCLQQICEDPRFFKSPGKFLPERFMRDDTTLAEEYKNTNPFATLPFGFGPRNCVGQRFAETEMYIVTAKFFRRFKVTLSPGSNQTMEYKYRTFVAPKSAVPLTFTPRM